jgi:hypothetical protein
VCGKSERGCGGRGGGDIIGQLGGHGKIGQRLKHHFGAQHKHAQTLHERLD